MNVKVKVLFGGLFVILAFLTMFTDALFHIEFIEKPSMALAHAHAGEPKAKANDGTVSLEQLPPEEPHSVLEPEIIIEDGQEIKVFNMVLEAVKKEIRPGVYVEMWGFNRQIPGPEIRVKAGDHVRVIFTNLHNNADMEHTIHWHGLHVPTDMDGVPFISQEPVKVNESYVYEFIAGPSGTHMYHCHVDTDHHIAMGMYGPFIVEPTEPEKEYDREIVWTLSEASTKHHAHRVPGTADSPYFTGNYAFKQEYDHYLINGKAYPATDPVIVKEGDLIRMRMINIGKEPYSIHVHGHSFKVTHKDGFLIPEDQQRVMDTIPILPGERYDIEMEMNNPGVWAFHDHITKHATNDGFYPGGMLSTIVYEGYEFPEFLENYFKDIEAYNTAAYAIGQAPEQAYQSGGHGGHGGGGEGGGGHGGH